jgi:hypothetical protein
MIQFKKEAEPSWQAAQENKKELHQAVHENHYAFSLILLFILWIRNQNAFMLKVKMFRL